MVYVGSLFPEVALFIKSWKEVLLGIAGLLFVYILYKHRAWYLYVSRLFVAIVVFAVLTLVLIPLFFANNGLEATLAGVLINLRYLLFFGLVYGALKLFPQYYRTFVGTFLGGALVVLGFMVLQLTVLPHDVLRYIGYNASTIQPYMTVDENIDYVRVNSTLRGPNPLGAYGVIVLSVTLAWLLVARSRLARRVVGALGVLAAGGALAVAASYSRAAALGAFVAVALVCIATFGRRISLKIWAVVAVSTLLIVGGVYAFRDTQVVSQVILHQDPEEAGAYNSNDGHVDSLAEGVARLLRQPLGGGVGSTGSASLHTNSPTIIENQLLFTAHEVGWVGLALLVYIQVAILVGLWRRRAHWLALGVFAGGIGLIVVGFVLPVWADDTVSLVWWGLAAVALASVAVPHVGSAKAITTKFVKKEVPHGSDR